METVITFLLFLLISSDGRKDADAYVIADRPVTHEECMAAAQEYIPQIAQTHPGLAMVFPNCVTQKVKIPDQPPVQEQEQGQDPAIKKNSI